MATRAPSSGAPHPAGGAPRVGPARCGVRQAGRAGGGPPGGAGAITSFAPPICLFACLLACLFVCLLFFLFVVRPAAGAPVPVCRPRGRSLRGGAGLSAVRRLTPRPLSAGGARRCTHSSAARPRRRCRLPRGAPPPLPSSDEIGQPLDVPLSSNEIRRPSGGCDQSMRSDSPQKDDASVEKVSSAQRACPRRDAARQRPERRPHARRRACR